MAELEDRLLRDLARLRERSSPPPGAEQRVRAALDAAIGPDPGDGDDGGSALGDGGSSTDGLGNAGLGGSGKLALAAKVVTAAAAATGVGLLVLNLGVRPAQQTRATSTTPVEVATPNTSKDPPRSTAQSPPAHEPPIVVTAPADPRSRGQRPTARDEDLLGAEVALLERARETDDLKARLGLLEQHRQRFWAGHLAAERESLRISTLCELDQLDAAHEAAEEFLLAHPRSPLRLRMRGACPELDILAD